ncbi:MAG: ATP-binding cassette domain-containing protein [Desulfuromonas sp.]|nr:ATP-binding cassette domain-containing protein [Desulfuromonas sp.]
MIDSALLNQPLKQLLEQRPYLRDFFTALGLAVPADALTLHGFLTTIPAAQLEEFALDHASITQQCLEFITQMELFQQQDQTLVREVTIKAGVDKSGNPEAQDLLLRAGEVVSVVGPTGSGKSRLLADIECLAQGDTPSKRQILLNGAEPDENRRLSGEQQLVAQLSQNMNFVMDLSVREFITMHAESRLISDVAQRVEQIFTTAVDLAGEPFTLDTPVTALSGGQSRALMISDVACLSASPIVLIDEIENAGVDRRRALDLLVKEEKIVLMATHDPLLALSGDRRIVIRNGGIAAIIVTSDEERQGLVQLVELDQQMSRLRDQVRHGERIVFAKR